MPRITRVRQANIQYDHGKKQIPDLTLDLQGENSVVLLSNGGGKTLLLQLILQTVLPNERLGGRRISDLLQSQKYTGHVAVEWLLDGVEGDRVCTGFCFSHAAGQDQSLRYFNYLFQVEREGSLSLFEEETTGGSALGITTLPFLVPGENHMQPIGYQEFKDWLRENPRVQIFDQNSTYQDRLRLYQIIPEEWKNMRDTNGSEGGVDKFFEKSRTTPALVNNLLIPSVEQVIFQSETKREELMKAFAEYRSTLLQMPIIQKNLKDFAAIREHSGEVVDSVCQLNRLQSGLEEQTQTLLRLGKTYKLEAQHSQEEMAVKQEEITALAQALGELDWKIESYGVFTKEQELGEYQHHCDKMGRECQKAQARWQEMQKQERQLEGLLQYGIHQEAKAEAQELQGTLEAMDRSEPELIELIHELRSQLSQAWQDEKLKIKGQIQAHLRDEAELTEQLTLSQGLREVEEASLEVVRQENADIKSWMDQYRQLQQEIHKVIPQIALEEPLRTLSDLKSEFEACSQRLAQSKVDLDRLRQEREQAMEKIIQLRDQRSRLEGERKALYQDLTQYRDQEEEVVGALTGIRIFSTTPLKERDLIQDKLRARWRQAQDSRATAQAKLVSEREKWEILADRDFYVPHHELLAIQGHLARQGVYVVLGSEWLYQQPLEPREKERILKTCPLLAYGFVVEGGQAKAVRLGLGSLRGVSASYPLLFFVKEKLGSSWGDQWGERVLLYHDSMPLFTSPEAFVEYKQGHQEGLAQLEQDLSVAQNEEEAIHDLRSRVELFMREYSFQQVQAWQQRSLELDEQLEDLHTKAAQAQEESLRLDQGIRCLEQQKEALTQESIQRAYILERLQEYMGWQAQAAQKQRRVDELARKLEVCTQKIKECQEAERRIYRAQAELGSVLIQAHQRLEEHENEFIHYQLEQASPVASPLPYQELKPRFAALDSQLQQKQQERTHIQKLFHKAREQMQAAQEEISRLGLDQAWLAENSRPVTREEIRRAHQLTTADKDAWERARDRLHEAEKQVQVFQSLRDHLAAVVTERFRRQPYSEYAAHAHPHQWAAYKEEHADLLSEKSQIQEEITRLQAWADQSWEAYQMVEEGFTSQLKSNWDRLLPISQTQTPERPATVIRRVEGERSQTLQSLIRQRGVVDSRFSRYLNTLEETRNTSMRQFVRDVRGIMDEQRLYDYDYVQTQFLRIFEALDAYQRQYTLTLQECEKNFQHLANLCWRRAVTVYESVCEIPKNSRIKLYTRDLQVIRLDWKTQDEAQQREKIQKYLQQVVADLHTWKEKGMDDDEIQRRMEELLSTRSLVNVIAPISECQVLVNKPRKESLLRQRLDYSPWDEVSRWSGGEEYSIYITMFMVILSFIRQQTHGIHNSWKVLLADNPFGKASSDHILETVFQVAQANQIQFICFTAHKEDAILRHFPVVYSLQLRDAYGREVLKAERLESGFYRVG